MAIDNGHGTIVEKIEEVSSRSSLISNQLRFRKKGHAQLWFSPPIRFILNHMELL